MKAKEFLSQRGIPYVEKDVSRDRQAAVEMIRLSGQQGVPVIALDGQVIVGFNRPRLEQVIAQRTAAGAPGRKPLGAMVGDAASVARRRPDIPATGAYVGGVRPGSPAERAGLHTGDVITGVDRAPVRDAADLAQALRRDGAPSHVLEVVRNGSAQQIEVRL